MMNDILIGCNFVEYDANNNQIFQSGNTRFTIPWNSHYDSELDLVLANIHFEGEIIGLLHGQGDMSMINDYTYYAIVSCTTDEHKYEQFDDYVKIFNGNIIYINCVRKCQRDLSLNKCLAYLKQIGLDKLPYDRKFGMKDECVVVGDYGIAISGENGNSVSGYRGTSISGNGGVSNSGYRGLSIAGHFGTSISLGGGTSKSGYRGKSISGDRGTSIVEDAGKAKAGNDGILQIYYYDENTRKRFAIGYIGEN